MEANELRIGNYVYLYNPESWGDYINEVVKVEAIDLQISEKEKTHWKNSFGSLKLVCDKQEFNQFSEYAKPIPLTKELYYEVEKQLIGKGFEYSHSTITNRLFIYVGILTIELEYVHQLQNLYFALTNEELTIKQITNERN